jgi:hypothetical protein
MTPTFEYFTLWDGEQEDKRLVAGTCPNLSFFLISSLTVPNFCFQNVWTDTSSKDLWGISITGQRGIMLCPAI